MMRIERIKIRKLPGLADVDWTFPAGPVMLFCIEESHRRLLQELLLELLYDQESPRTMKSVSNKGLLEVWMTGENTRYHIRREFVQQDSEFVASSTLVREQVTGQDVSIPDNLSLGEYLWRANLSDFRQGAVVNWPEHDQCDLLKQRVNNLRQGGDEGLSFLKMRASLSGAQKRVTQQTGNMALVKAEYDALRREWEAVHRQQDEDRLRLIEIKNLQENEAILSEKITSTLLIQERLALLKQNPDYPELRQLHGELAQLEERIRTVELKLTTLTSESEIEWAVIEGLRAECLEWASLQEQVEQIAAIAVIRAGEISELEDSLQSSGYAGLPKDEDQRLRRMEEDRDIAREELDTLVITKNELKNTQLIYTEQTTRLEEFADMADVTEADEAKLAQRERRLKQWQSSTIFGSLDRSLQRNFSGTSIGEKLASRLRQYYEGYHATNFEEFTSRLKEYHDLQQLVAGVEIEIEQLQAQVDREAVLHRIEQTGTEHLNQAFLLAKVVDYSGWHKGWEDYQNKHHQRILLMDELQLLRKKSLRANENLQLYTEQLREKLGDWDTSAKDREDVLAAVFKVASQLRAKDEAERERAAYSQRFNDLIGDRDMARLAKKLEPLMDLERETRVSDDERRQELIAWQNERLETRKHRAEVEQRLQGSQKLPSLTDLDKKIEIAKQQWMGYEDLDRALNDAQDLLESSWQEWQAKFGKTLNREMKWIISKIPTSLTQEMTQSEPIEVMRDYFAYRMALAQLTLGNDPELPLFFSVGAIHEGERFWLDATVYLRNLSLRRQIILITPDHKLGKSLSGAGWSPLNMT